MALTYTIRKVYKREKHNTVIVLDLSNGQETAFSLSPEDFVNVTASSDARAVVKAKAVEAVQRIAVYEAVANYLQTLEGSVIA